MKKVFQLMGLPLVALMMIFCVQGCGSDDIASSDLLEEEFNEGFDNGVTRQSFFKATLIRTHELEEGRLTLVFWLGSKAVDFSMPYEWVGKAINLSNLKSETDASKVLKFSVSGDGYILTSDEEKLPEAGTLLVTELEHGKKYEVKMKYTMKGHTAPFKLYFNGEVTQQDNTFTVNETNAKVLNVFYDSNKLLKKGVYEFSFCSDNDQRAGFSLQISKQTLEQLLSTGETMWLTVVDSNQDSPYVLTPDPYFNMTTVDGKEGGTRAKSGSLNIKRYPSGTMYFNVSYEDRNKNSLMIEYYGMPVKYYEYNPKYGDIVQMGNMLDCCGWQYELRRATVSHADLQNGIFNIRFYNSDGSFLLHMPYKSVGKTQGLTSSSVASGEADAIYLSDEYNAFPAELIFGTRKSDPKLNYGYVYVGELEREKKYEVYIEYRIPDKAVPIRIHYKGDVDAVEKSETPYVDYAPVDLGLSVQWASFNLGAQKPEEYGGYYAWGEIETKKTYSWDTYKWCKGSEMTKYCLQPSYGTVDKKYDLEPSDDVVCKKWGGKWRMPTFLEFDELKEKCKWTWTTRNNVKGYLVEGTNGNTIFLPAAGYRNGSSLEEVGSRGSYWTTTLQLDASDCAAMIGFDKGVVYTSNAPRFSGYSIRPVYK